MKKLGYILNFSTNYNANNYLYYFLPGISSGRILLFDELTKKQIPSSDRHQETAIREKLKTLKDHWDMYRLDPNNQYEQLKINIVLDYKPWEFTGFGDYSFFPFAKVRYLRQQFEKYFNPYDLSKIVFQYFIVKNKAEDAEELAHFLDEKEGINDSLGEVEFGPVKRNLVPWPEWEKIQEFVRKNMDVSGKLSSLQISDEERTQIKNLANEIETKLQEGFHSDDRNPILKDFLTECSRGFKRDLLSNLLKIEDLNNFDKKKMLLGRIFRKFSSKHYLREKDLLFRFAIDTKTNASRIKGYESLTAFLVESIDFFGQDEPGKFITNGSRDNTITIKEIEFDEEKVNLLFGRYKSFSNQNKDGKEVANNTKKRVKQFKFNSEIDPKQFFQIDERLQSKFLTVNNLKHRATSLFSRKNPDVIMKELNDNSIRPMEDQIKAQAYRISETYSLEGDYGLSESYDEMNLREIEISLNNLKKDDQDPALSSGTTSTKYENAKAKFKDTGPGLRQTFVDSLRILPISGDLHLFFPLVLILVALFGMPLYTFKLWPEALIFAVIITGLLSLTALILWYVFRSEIMAKYENIYLENLELFSRFQEHVTELSNLSVNVRKSTLRRKNLKELDGVRSSLLEEQRKYDLYSSFYDEILSQISENGHSFTLTPGNAVADINIPPLYDVRNSRQDNESNLVITAGTAVKNYEKISAQLGIIKSIKSK